jgi:Spy/CpxP family protein refolding chaperone
MKKQLFVVACLFLFLVSLPALAQMRGQGMMSGQRTGEEANNPLNLTADQMAKIRAMNLQFEKTMITLRANLQSTRLDLLGLIESDADQKKIDAAVSEMTPLMGEMIKAALGHWRDVRGVLTPDQKAQLDRRMGPGMGPGMGLGMGMGRGMMGAGLGMGRGMMGMSGGMGMGWDDEEDGGRGWGMGMWRDMCPRWW